MLNHAPVFLCRWGTCGCLCCRVYGLLSLGRYVSPLPVPRNNHQLVTSGMYSEFVCAPALCSGPWLPAVPNLLVTAAVDEGTSKCFCVSDYTRML
jgi:hypothetical protein